MPEEEYYTSQVVRNRKSYFETPNEKLFTQSFLPLEGEIKGTVYCTWADEHKICMSFSTWGYAVFAANLLGHGRSDGIRCYMGDMKKVAATSFSFFKHVRCSDPYIHLPAFLFEDMKPSKPHLFAYGLLFGLADTWTAMPDNKMVGKAIHYTERLKIIASNPQRCQPNKICFLFFFFSLFRHFRFPLADPLRRLRRTQPSGLRFLSSLPPQSANNGGLVVSGDENNNNCGGEEPRIVPFDLHKEATEYYMAYALSVLLGCALPDVRDGLLNLFAMHDLEMSSKKPYKKSARVVLGKFHPHGDTTVYDSLVRMAQSFSLRCPLIQGYGNFGSIDADPAAALRYTECRLDYPTQASFIVAHLC
ncbi:hypothetical protein F2Q68_00043905 [Brassica cretica]|uniref:Topo IIA-type catalytic domain-containing protein n=1 Tax=Brassica cretica TaxID=69181 RepID=A0A8S9LQM7_BRACR|nr:hypothetical protein F2Q68_00043905 [Brassica cretica]